MKDLSVSQVLRVSKGIGERAIAEYLGRTDPDSVVALNKRVAALERQYQKSVKLV